MIIKAIFLYFRLNFKKIALLPSIRSAKDYDRMRFEYELCKISTNVNYKVLYVGIHNRSFVYQYIFPFTFIDISDEFLLKDKKNIFVKDCKDISEDYDLVVLSGVFNYGTDLKAFKKILNKDNFKNFLVLDWIKNYSYHKEFFSNETRPIHLKRSFFYYSSCKN